MNKFLSQYKMLNLCVVCVFCFTCEFDSENVLCTKDVSTDDKVSQR